MATHEANGCHPVRLVSSRTIDDKQIEAQIIDGMVVCGKCSNPTQLMAPKHGTKEFYCPKCHLSFTEQE
jgi:Zn finger protein HypA/HybF involved in hydrogenase expression